MTSSELFKQQEPVLLEAYGHQVGGHSLLLRYGDALCKPLLPREHFYYETIPHELKAFTPRYNGVVSVVFERDEEGEYQVLAYPQRFCSSNHIGFLSRIDHTALSHKGLPQRAPTGPVHKEPNGIIVKGEGGSHSFRNPWSKQCMRSTHKLLHQMGDDLKGLHQDYMVIEDLTANYRCPVILDLKIGTRQYGDDVSEEKKQLHIARCAHSTSNKLGVRICGMQLYNAVTDEYTFRDKYYGRDVSETDFYQVLNEFLHTGMRFRDDLIPHLVLSLRELRAVILRQDSYRFYSSSLLLIYDGSETPPNSAATDKAASPTPPQHTPTPHSLHSSQTAQGVSAQLQTESLPPSIRLSSESYIKVHMIDFAHTTHQGYSDPIKYSGPDEGYVVGLDTLIHAFENMSGGSMQKAP